MAEMNRNAYRTHSGRLVDLSAPCAVDIRLEDIAHHLARVCRFGGAVDTFYSVASHSVYVCQMVEVLYPGDLARARGALLHDSTEAYLGDMVSGLKRMCPEYRRVETAWANVIEGVFRVHFQHDGVIKNADLRARLSECADLFTGYPRELLLGGEGDLTRWHEPCRPLDPDASEWEFLATAARLGLG